MDEQQKAKIEQAQHTDTDRIFTLPNMLSFFRLLLIPAIIFLYERGSYWGAFGVLVLSGVTDVVDGWIARTFHLVSDFGKAIDPVADKLTQIAVLLCLLPMKFWWVVGVMVFKEVTIGILGLVALRHTRSVYSASWYGKLCTVVIHLSMVFMILWEIFSAEPIPSLFVTIDAIVIVALVALAFVNYFIYFTRILREARENQPRETK